MLAASRTRRGRSSPPSPLRPSAASPPSPSGVVAGERERELARVVDVVDAHGDLVAEVEHVLDPVDALAPPELRDVQQAVAAREDVHERPELGDVHDLARVLGAELGGRRVEDELDAATGFLDRDAVLRPDA